MYSRDDLKNKLNEHIEQILAKPSLTGEDYAILKERFKGLPEQANGSLNWAIPALILAMTSIGLGGGENGV